MPDVSPEVLAQRLGERMRSWRSQNGLSQEAAGQRAGGRALQQWSRWERSAKDGRNPTLASLLVIAETMEVELPELIADLYWQADEN